MQKTVNRKIEPEFKDQPRDLPHPDGNTLLAKKEALRKAREQPLGFPPGITPTSNPTSGRPLN